MEEAMRIYAEYRDKVSLCWGKDTSFKGTYDGSKGQCYSTALLTRHVFGGEIMAGWVKTSKGGREHHFWNLIAGMELDFTSDQYGGDGIHPIVAGKIYEKTNINNPKFLKLYQRYYNIRKY